MTFHSEISQYQTACLQSYISVQTFTRTHKIHKPSTIRWNKWYYSTSKPNNIGLLYLLMKARCNPGILTSRGRTGGHSCPVPTSGSEMWGGSAAGVRPEPPAGTWGWWCTCWGWCCAEPRCRPPAPASSWRGWVPGFGISIVILATSTTFHNSAAARIKLSPHGKPVQVPETNFLSTNV